MKELCQRLALAIIVLSTIACAQDSSAEKSKLIALENAWNQAQIHRDGKALTRLISDKFVYTDWDGTVFTRDKFLADTQDPSVHTTLVANDDVQVYLYPGVAIVTGAYHAKGKSQGKPFDHYGRFTDTWIMNGDHWQCIASHTNLLKK